MKKDVLINLRVEQDLKDSFQNIVEKEGYTMSEVLTASMRDVVRRGAIPINLYGKMPRKDRNIVSIQDIKVALENYLASSEYRKLIKKVSLFGSYANGEMTPKSDIDLLLETDNGFSLFALGDFESSLEKALNKKIDVTTNGQLDPYFSKIVNRERIILYERQ